MTEENGADLRLIRCKRGGWLAVSPAGQSLQIGVVSETQEGARAKFARSAGAWADILAKGADLETTEDATGRVIWTKNLHLL